MEDRLVEDSVGVAALSHSAGPAQHIPSRARPT